MSRTLMVGGGLAALAAALVLWWSSEFSDGTHAPFEPPSRLVEPSPLCPWREPEADVRRFFPETNRREMETRILSGVRVELAKQLGRQPEAEENALILHRVYRDARPFGATLTRRVKGEHGAIEIVLAVTDQGRVRGVHLQRLREPATIAAALQDDNWLKTFQGRTWERGWETDDLGSVPVEARISVQAIREGVRSLLILLAASEIAGVPSTSKPHH